MSCSGFSATTIWMVEQFGLAMMLRLRVAGDAPAGSPPAPPAARPGPCGTGEVLSMTTQPAAAARGAKHGRDLGAGRGQDDVDALEVERVEVLDLQDLVLAERDFARRPSARRPGRPPRRPGNSRSARVFSISRPTLPGGADDRDPVTHDFFLRLKAKGPQFLSRPLGSSDPLEFPSGRVPSPDSVPVVFLVFRVITAGITLQNP